MPKKRVQSKPPTQRTNGGDRVLISCAGVGMGNASRMIAIVEALTDLARQNHRTISCHIVTWGPAHTFLREYQRESSLAFELIESHSYGTATELFSPGSWAGLAGTFVRNLRFLRATMRRLRPNLILLDSDYHFPAYFHAGCPIVYLGQASDVLERARRDGYRPASWRERVNFNMREKLDSFLQGLFAHWILVPSFSVVQSSNAKVHKIPLIVRKEFLGKAKDAIAKQSVGILLSGSELEKNAFLTLADQHGLQILTPGKERLVNTVPSHAGTLDDFDVIFTQGGLSSISECIARSKFLVVFPISHHPEQLLNANEVEQLGLGMRSALEDLKSFPALLKKIASKRRSNGQHKACVGVNGAEAAAGFIYQKLSRSDQRGAAGIPAPC